MSRKYLIQFGVTFLCCLLPSTAIRGGTYADSSRTPIVSARIHGQLGNNLFQVATAYALAKDNHVVARFAQVPPELAKHVFFRCKLVPTIPGISCIYREPIASYQKITYHPNMQLDGYFQSEKYFAHHRKELLKLLAPRSDDLAYIKRKYKRILRHPNSVGVQIRFYKWEDSKSEIYPQYGMDYLKKAMALFPKSALFVVSSNNIEYARKSIPAWAKKRVVLLQNEPNYIDLRILSMCKHNIITNSSFGWWGAWLNTNPKKTVVYPRPLFYGLLTQDYAPKSWRGVNALPDKN